MGQKRDSPAMSRNRSSSVETAVLVGAHRSPQQKQNNIRGNFSESNVRWRKTVRVIQRSSQEVSCKMRRTVAKTINLFIVLNK